MSIVKKYLFIEEEKDNEWNDLEDEFWEQLAEDMSEEGYNHSTGEYHWIEMSYYKYDPPTSWNNEVEPQEEERINIKKNKHGGFLG